MIAETTTEPPLAMPDRIQQEVDDLLAKLESRPLRPPLTQRLVRAATAPFRGLGDFFSGAPLPNLSAGHILLIAIGVVVFAYFLDPTGSGIVGWVIVGGIIVFIAAFAMSLRRRSRPPAKYWRDKPIDLREPGVGRRFRSWWTRRRR